MNTYRWQKEPSHEGKFDNDPLATWKALRWPGQSARSLIQLPGGATDVSATMARLGWHVADAYMHNNATAKRPFVTVSRVATAASTAPMPRWVPDIRRSGADTNLQHQPPTISIAIAQEVASAIGSASLVKFPASSTPNPVVGIIDSTCAFLHQQFRDRQDKSRTRLTHVWDQDDNAHGITSPWRAVPDQGYGRELLQADINAVIAQNAPEQKAYQSLNVDVPPLTAPWSHGTHMLAIAAGLEDPFAIGSQDAASNAPMIAVQLPREAIENTHGVWLNAYVLDGLRYILDRAGINTPVVVNVSLEAGIGPHDGTSLLEAAIDDLVDSTGGRLTVVVAAGNSRLQRRHLDFGPVEQAKFSVITTDALESTTIIDSWLQTTSDVGISMSVDARHGFLQPVPPITIKPGETFGLYNDHGEMPVALASLSRAGRSPNGQGVQAGLLIAAPEQRDSGRQPAPVGEWNVTIAQSNSTKVPVRVWLARDDVVTASKGEAKRGRLTFSRGPAASTTGTINGLAGRHAVVVGAYESLTLQPAKMYEHSGEGLGSVQPDVCGLTAINQGPGAPDVWFFSDIDAKGWRRQSQRGTSVAAAFVTRRIANVLESNPSLLGKQAVLNALKAAYPRPPPQPATMTSWTGAFWVGARRSP